MKIVRTIGLSIGVALSFFYLGCGSVQIAEAGIPNISQIVPQALSVGSSGVTMKVVGSNFSNQTVVMWNGSELPTTMVDGSTLTSPVQTASLSVPGLAQLQVQNFVSGAKSQTVPVTISTSTTNTSALSITTTSLPSSTSGTPYSYALIASGGTPAFSWKVTSGKLPVEMSLAPTTGVLSGTPSTPGSYSFGVAVSDQSNPVQTKTATLTFVVLPKPVTIITTSLPSAQIGAAYSQTVVALGGTTPYHWAITAGALPAGLSLTAAKGLISGIPTASGNFPFSITATDKNGVKSTAPLAISVSPASMSITTASLPSGVVGTTYSSILAVAGGTPGYTWSLASGSLPAGLALAPNGVISGTPTTSSTSTFAVSVHDSSNPAQTQTATETITIAASALHISTSSLPSATPGTTYSAILTATGGTPAYTWSVTAGSLPAGLTLASNGVISGAPATGGTSSFTISVHDSGNPVQTQSANVSIAVSATPLKISTTSLPTATSGTAYSSTLAANGGTPTYTWSVTAGSLPAGLTLASNGTISGTTTASTAASFTVSVHDSGNPVQTQSASETISFSSTPLKITTASLPNAQGGKSYSQSLAASGGTLVYKWAIASGALPAGLSLSSSTGIISGTPTSTGTSTFTTTVSDSSSPTQMTSAALTVVVSGTTLSISSSTLAAAAAGTAYSQTLQATGGAGPYTWSVSSGQLPAGLSLSSSTGTISGTPTSSAVSSSFTVKVTDASSPAQTATASTSITLATASIVPLSITSSSLPSGTAGTAYSSSLQANGGTPSYTWSITSGSLPAGLTMAATTGVISGIPSSSGTTTFTATVHDNGSPVQTASVSSSITVAAAASTVSGPGTFWYVRPDGGTRFSANVPNGQCDGKSDAAYPGSGTNQHCAFSSIQYLYLTGAYGSSTWVISGGDTVVVRGCAALPGEINSDAPHCRIGWETPSGSALCNGINSPWGCSPPPIPSGTSAAHTRILGGCAYDGNCNPVIGYPYTSNNLAQLFGGFGTDAVIYLTGSSYVDLAGLEITEHNGTCSQVGAPNYPAGCSNSPPKSDFARYGILPDQTTSNITLQDVYIHGLTTIGMGGPIGGPFTLNRVIFAFNAFAGWNFDSAAHTPDAPGSSITQSYVTMIGNGCSEEYPIVHTQFPAKGCWDSNSGGFGDSWSGQDTNLDSFTCDHCVVAYNTKDGGLGPHTLLKNLSLTNSIWIDNMGQQGKWGMQSGSTTVIENNLVVGNCLRMSAAIPGAVQNFNQSTGLGGSYLTNYCRAAGNMWDYFTDSGSTVLYANNTFVGYNPTFLELGCITTGSCVNEYTFKNNIFLGYTTSLNYFPNTGQAPGLYFFDDTIKPISSNNIEYGIRNGDTCGVNGILCSDPLLVNEPAQGAVPNQSQLDNFNFYPTASSPAVGAGLAIPGLVTDYYGATRSAPPTIGAVEP